MVEVFSSGGGTQSTCIAALIIQGRLPKPDIAVIADTGYECSFTWRYMEEVTAPALKAVGVDIVRVKGWKSVPEHGKDFLSHNGNTLLLPCFTDESGTVGKFSGYCSARWKIEAIDRYLSKVHGLTRSKYRKWIGYSLDEHRRANRMMAGEEFTKGLLRLPMIHDVPLRRHEGIREVEKMGWPTPPRSRCWNCPNQKDDEWMETKQNFPDEFQKAVRFEKDIQEFDSCAWLHRSCRPLETVDFSAEQGLFDSTDYCSSGSCFI